MAEFEIAGRMIGIDHRPLVVAEIGINHGGNLDVAMLMADAAIEAGAEAIKHQTHTVIDEMSIEARDVRPGNAEVSIYEVIEGCTLDEESERALKEHIEGQGRIYFSTPFSRSAVDRIERLDLPVVKIGSGECANLPLVSYVCRLGKPLIVSTGMQSIASIRPTVDLIRRAGVPFALLQCTNLYPTPPRLVRLGGMTELQEAFPDAVIGLSDHSESPYPCIGAVALGASILERHFTDSYDRDGPDISCSMDPAQLTEIIAGANVLYQARGGRKAPAPEEDVTIAFAFSSVVATRSISAGELLTESNIWVMRPASGAYSANEYFGSPGMSVGRGVLLGLNSRCVWRGFWLGLGFG